MKNQNMLFIVLLIILSSSINSSFCFGGLEHRSMRLVIDSSGYYYPMNKNGREEGTICTDISGDLRSFMQWVLNKKFIKETLCCLSCHDENREITVQQNINQANKTNDKK